MTGGYFTTAVTLYPSVTQSSQARRKSSSTSTRHRDGVTPHAEEEQRLRGTGAAAGSQEQASTVCRSYPFIPSSPHMIYQAFMKKNTSKESNHGLEVTQPELPLVFQSVQINVIMGKAGDWIQLSSSGD